VLARGGGSREDLSVFDGEALARSLAASAGVAVQPMAAPNTNARPGQAAVTA
jgi:hypothetical protein